MEGCLAVFRPIPLTVFTREVVQWSCDVREVRNEGPVKVTESQEASDVLNTRGGWPLRDTVDFDGIHADRTIADDHSEVFHFFFVEFAFRWLEEQAEFL